MSVPPEPCTGEDYALVENVVERFWVQNFSDYHDLYLYKDVLALAGCMESMRSGWYEENSLDMIHSITFPSAS